MYIYMYIYAQRSTKSPRQDPYYVGDVRALSPPAKTNEGSQRSLASEKWANNRWYTLGIKGSLPVWLAFSEICKQRFLSL